MEQTPPKPNLLAEAAKRKIEAQKKGANSKFGKFDSRKPSFGEKKLLGPSWGGRNSQGKP